MGYRWQKAVPADDRIKELYLYIEEGAPDDGDEETELTSIFFLSGMYGATGLELSNPDSASLMFKWTAQALGKDKIAGVVLKLSGKRRLKPWIAGLPSGEFLGDYMLCSKAKKKVEKTVMERG